MDDKRIDELIGVYRDGLLKDTLPFWLKHNLDREYGGYLNCLDRDGTVIDTDKGGWQTGRTIWTLCNTYNTVDNPQAEWLDAAQLGMDFLEKHLIDTDGRMFYHLTREGKPIRKRRYLFTEMFGMIAYASYAKATGKDEYAKKARDLYALTQRYLNDPSLLPAKFTDTRPAKAIGYPMIMIVTCQILRQCLESDEWDAQIDVYIDEIERDFVKPDLEVCMEQVDPDGNLLDHFDGRTLNPGHAIEAAWFILHEARCRNNDARLIKLGTQILDYMWARGWDKEYGGMLYYVDLKGLPVTEYWHDMKFWWPQNETIIATLLAYALTGDEKYATWHQTLHDWTYKHFPDPEYGEWYGYLHRDGRISSRLKGNLFKGPFHMPRMQLYCWQLLEAMKVGGVSH